jgi:hypothetical protein
LERSRRDAFDAAELAAAVSAFAQEMMMHQLTDPSRHARGAPELLARNDRMRIEGTRNLLTAASTARASRFLAQIIAWRRPGRGHVVDQHERLVLK